MQRIFFRLIFLRENESVGRGGDLDSQEFPSKDVDSFRDLCVVGFSCPCAIFIQKWKETARVMKHSVGVSAMTS